MPTRFARAKRKDTVGYRNADGDVLSGTVLRDTKKPGTPTSSKSASGGTLGAGVKSYRVAIVYDTLTTAPSTATTQTTSGSTSTVTVNVTAIVPSGTPAWTAWKVYGRTAGSELLMATVTSPTKTWTDDGSLTPSGALPTDSGNATIKVSGLDLLANKAKATAVTDTGKYFKR